MRSTLVIPALLALTTSLAAQYRLDPSVRGIQLNTTVTRTVPPDYVVVRVAIISEDNRAAQVGEANARTVARVRDALRAIGLTNDSVAVGTYSVQSYRRDRDGRVNGYQARTELNVMLRDLDRIGEVIDAALGAGANSVAPLQYGATTLDAVRDLAYADAVRTLYRSAGVVADASGQRLAGPAQLTVNDRVDQRACAVCLAAAPARDARTEVTPGVVAVIVTASGWFALEAAGAR